MSITIMELATFRLKREPTTMADFEEANLPMLGGCQACGATVAAYNSCPTKSGYIACVGCVPEHFGYETVEQANYAVFLYPAAREKLRNLLFAALKDFEPWVDDEDICVVVDKVNFSIKICD
jgi:hypothetical protein